MSEPEYFEELDESSPSIHVFDPYEHGGIFYWVGWYSEGPEIQDLIRFCDEQFNNSYGAHISYDPEELEEGGYKEVKHPYRIARLMAENTEPLLMEVIGIEPVFETAFWRKHGANRGISGFKILREALKEEHLEHIEELYRETTDSEIAEENLEELREMVL
ncbi:MAG: hypothetical protein SVV03_00110 [Candidatus Nanohaloarchaea archaeon]|nr:hypothetical protein [Candidatus Nanohaloarchaea archaeon]